MSINIRITGARVVGLVREGQMNISSLFMWPVRAKLEGFMISLVNGVDVR